MPGNDVRPGRSWRMGSFFACTCFARKHEIHYLNICEHAAIRVKGKFFPLSSSFRLPGGLPVRYGATLAGTPSRPMCSMNVRSTV